MEKLKKIFLITFVLLAICVTFLPKEVSAISVTNYKPKYGTVTTSLNFRATASTKKGKLGTLVKGTSVKILATTGDFYIVQLGTNEIGVVSKSYVKTSSSAPKGAKTYTMVTKKTGTTTGNIILRGGPGTSFTKRMTLDKGTNVTIVGYVSNWYVVITDGGNVGCIRKDLLKISSTSSGTTSNSQANTSTNTSNVSMSENEKVVFDLINNARTKKGLSKLTAGVNLFKLARLKSEDMVNKEYFSHTSPTYGDPFKMLTNYKVSYKVAGENIAGNPSLEDAVNAWLNSETHKENILSNSYNYVGIGITKSDIYGYVISVMFVGQ